MTSIKDVPDDVMSQYIGDYLVFKELQILLTTCKYYHKYFRNYTYIFNKLHKVNTCIIKLQYIFRLKLNKKRGEILYVDFGYLKQYYGKELNTLWYERNKFIKEMNKIHSYIRKCKLCLCYYIPKPDYKCNCYKIYGLNKKTFDNLVNFYHDSLNTKSPESDYDYNFYYTTRHYYRDYRFFKNFQNSIDACKKLSRIKLKKFLVSN